MATFKVGQRVRIVSAQWHPELIGKEATIAHIPPEGRSGGDCSLLIDGWDGRDYRSKYQTAACNWHNIAPLTDPLADAFIESIKRLKPYEEPKVPAIQKLGVGGNKVGG